MRSASVGNGPKKKVSFAKTEASTPTPPASILAQIEKGWSKNLRTEPIVPPNSKCTVTADGVVGGGSDALSPSNKGHQMLTKLGWKPGSSLGTVGSSNGQ